MMKNNIFGKLLCGTLMLFAAMSFTACVDDNEDVGMPYLELDSETLPFALEGGHATFTVKTNRPWFITKDEASDWLTVEPMVGDGTAQVEILLPEATTGREATLTFNIANSYGVYLTKTMKIQQGEIKPAEVLWHENFGDTGQTASPWPLVAEYDASKWEKGGLYGAEVTYTAVSGTMSLRNSGKLSAGYADASGAAKLFFGSGSPAFVAGNIQTDGAVNYTLNFGGAYSKSNNNVYDNTFYTDKFHVYISGDNQKWSEVTYTTEQADEYWVYATAQFTLKEPADVLYVKFAADEASVFAVDDVQLASGGAGGQEIDLANGTEGEGGNEGEEPTPGGDGTSDKTFPGAGKYLLLAKKEGAFVAATPSDKTSSYFYPAATAVTPANNALAADDTTNALAWTIAATSTEGQYTIAMPNNHYCYGTADHTSFNISSSVGTGGYTWTFTPHTDGSWKLLCVDYSKTLQYSAQYNSFGVYKEDADSYIYLYQLNAGGTAYELVGENAGGGEGEEPTPDTPTDAIWYETFGNPVQSGTKWPYTHENTANIMSGTGVVSGVTAYASYGTTARSTSSQYSPLSGVGHVWFPANKAIADNYFMVQKLALNGQTNLDLSFTLYGNGAVYKDGDIVLEMSADGSAWTKVNFTTGAIPGSDWVMGTASVTLKNAGEHLYIRFSSATTGGVRMDDVTLVAGNGGTEVDLSGSGSTTPEEPTPDTPTDTALSVKELVQMMIAGTAYTDKTVEGYVAAFAPTGADNMSQGTLILTDNDGAEYSGLTIYNYALSSLSLKVGDKVKIALTSGTTDNYNGLRQIKNIPADAVTVLSSGATIQYKTLTGAQLVADYEKYLSVPVQVLQAKPTAESVGKNFNTTLTFNDGTDFTVYGRSKWTAGSELTVADKTGTIRGILSTYNNPQLVPASTADVAAFTGTTTPDTPTDTALSVKELVQMMIAGTAYTDKAVEGYVAAFAPTGADNMSQGTLILTDNDGAEYSGLTIYNYALSSLSLKVGDKVKIALTSGTTDNYNGLRQIKNIPADAVTVLSSGATIQYKTLTGAQLVADYEKYLSVPVQVLQAKPTAASVGKNFNATLTFNDGTDFTVYGRSKWTAGSELTVADKTGTIRGILSTYNNPQLVPASTADVAPFTGTTTPDEGGDDPDPTPEPEPEPEPDPTPDPSGDVYFWKDDFSQFNSETGDSSTDLGANLKGSVDGFTESYQSVAKIYAAAAGTVKGGSSSVKGTLTTPAMKNVSGTAEATLSVDLAAWVGSAGADETKMVIKVNNGGTIDGAASVTTEQLTAEMKTYTFNLAGITSATTITIEASAASKKRFYLDNLIIKQK